MAIEDFDQVTIAPAKLRPFSKFIMSIGELPTSYLDSLSYAEQVTWFCDFLQNKVIPALNNNAEALQEVQRLMTELQEYVDNYFTNLDVQEEINNKLDQMAEDGTLTELIGNYIDPIIEEQNASIEEINTKVEAVASGSPLVATSTSDMTDQDRIYVNTTDGYWYYYNGTAWTQGGIYQATALDNDNLALDGRNTKTSKLAYYYGYEELKPVSDEYTFEYGDLSGSVGSEIVLSSQDYRKRTATPIEVNVGEFLTIRNMSDGYVSMRIFTVDSNNIIKSITPWVTTDFTLFNKKNADTVKYYILIQITGHYNWDVTEEELSKIRIYKTPISRQNYLHGIFETNIHQMATDHDDLYESATRCLTDLISYNGKVKFKCQDNYQLMILQYNKSTKLYIHDETPWTGDVLYYDFNKDYLYKLQFRRSNNSNLTATDIINNINIYPIEQTDSTIDYNFSNMILNNHQGYSNQYTTGMNLASSYYNSFKQGYKNAECDVRFTLDNVPVCCHDASFTDGGVTVVIAETNYTDLIEYDYYDGNHISSLDEIMSNCKKYGITLQLDQLSSTWNDTQWTNLFKVIDKYQMKDYVMYSAGNQTLITKILNFDSKANCVINVTDLSGINDLITLAHNNKNGKNKFILAINYSLITPEQVGTLNQTLEEDIYIGIWTIDNLNTLLTYIPYAYMITTNKITPSDIINSYL